MTLKLTEKKCLIMLNNKINIRSGMFRGENGFSISYILDLSFHLTIYVRGRK